MTDLHHLHALEIRLSHERGRLQSAKTPDERALRSAWISQIEREIEGEKQFLGITDADGAEDLGDDELLSALLD